jgi:hypothetical protein
VSRVLWLALPDIFSRDLDVPTLVLFDSRVSQPEGFSSLSTLLVFNGGCGASVVRLMTSQKYGLGTAGNGHIEKRWT